MLVGSGLRLYSFCSYNTIEIYSCYCIVRAFYLPHICHVYCDHVILPIYRYIFFVDWQDSEMHEVSAVIKRSGMDGSHVKTIVTSDHAGFPRDIAIDYQGDFDRCLY